MRDIFQKEIASAEPNVQSLTHALRLLITQALHCCETHMRVTFLLICSLFVAQVEPFEDAADSQGAVNMVLRLRWGCK